MPRPQVSEDALEALNTECKAIMTAKPESISIDERIEILAKSHKEARMQGSFQNTGSQTSDWTP